MKLGIAYVHPGWVHEAFSSSLRRYCTANPSTMVISARSGSLLARARNDATDAALKEGLDILLWIDTDMVFTNDDVNDLVSEIDQELPILGAFALAIDYSTDEVFPAGVPRLTMEEVDGSIRQVRGLGMAFTGLLLSEVARVKMRYERPFGENYDDDLGFTDQDVGFCLRAAEVGVRSFIDTAIKVGHIKERII